MGAASREACEIPPPPPPHAVTHTRAHTCVPKRTRGRTHARTHVHMRALPPSTCANPPCPTAPSPLSPSPGAGTVESVMSYCHYCLNDTSLERSIPFFQVGSRAAAGPPSPVGRLGPWTPSLPAPGSSWRHTRSVRSACLRPHCMPCCICMAPPPPFHDQLLCMHGTHARMLGAIHAGTRP